MEPIELNQTRSPLEQRKYQSPLKQWLKDTKIGGSLNLDIKTANIFSPESKYVAGDFGSTKYSLTGDLPIYAQYSKRGFGSDKLSLSGGVTRTQTSGSQSKRFHSSKAFSQGTGTNLLTSGEKEAFKTDLTTDPSTTNIGVGLKYEHVVAPNRRGKTSFSIGGGGSLTTTAAHMTGTDAGVQKIDRTFDATTHINTGSQDAWSTTYKRGDTEVHGAAALWNPFFTSWGGSTGYTSSGNLVNFAALSPDNPVITADYIANVDKYLKTETTSDLKHQVFSRQEKKSEFKPYLDIGAKHEWSLDKARHIPSGFIQASFGTKHSPNPGFSASIGATTSSYSRVPNLSFEVGGSKRGGHFGISYLLGGKDK
tara:strand:- start:583 stop:1680 length:1098 start_codon:yes stop_codon:yes gene_type:complete